MADMFDSGVHSFESWAKQKPTPCGEIFYNRYLGPFNPNMTAEEANRRLNHVGKITQEGQRGFMRGWNTAKQRYHKNS